MKLVKRVMSVAVTACLLSQATLAKSVEVNNVIAKEYARLNYQLETVWDQKDPTFRSNVVDAFTKNMKEIQAKHKLSNDEVIAALLTDAELEPNAKIELQSFVDYAKTNNISNEERDLFITNLVKNSQSTGANFDSGSMAGILGLAALVGVIVYLVAATEEPEEDKDPVDVCNDGNPNNNAGANCEPCSDDDSSNDYANFCDGYRWRCTSTNSFYSYSWTSEFYEQARSNSLSYCVANTPYYDTCSIRRCEKVH